MGRPGLSLSFDGPLVSLCGTLAPPFPSPPNSGFRSSCYSPRPTCSEPSRIIASSLSSASSLTSWSELACRSIIYNSNYWTRASRPTALSDASASRLAEVSASERAAAALSDDRYDCDFHSRNSVSASASRTLAAPSSDCESASCS